MTTVSKLSSLPKFKAVGKNKYVACCPAHDDKHPSLSITDAKDKVLVHCFSGCSQTDVIDALRSQGLWHAYSKPDPWVFTADELESTRGWLRDRAVTIYGGTNEVQQNIIAKRVLGLPD